MNHNPNNPQIPEAFDSILQELPKSRNNLVKEITAAAENGDYNAVAELTERRQRNDG